MPIMSVYRLSFESEKKWFICSGVYDLCLQRPVRRQGDATQLRCASKPLGQRKV